jgi:general nucleoside transport system permease protein
MNSLTEWFMKLNNWQRGLVAAGVAFFGLAITRVIAGADDLTSGRTFIAMVATMSPILFAALGGLFSERAGVANIGLEGMMVLGTWFAGFAGWHWGPWAALVGGAFGGLLGGLLHALATVTFGVDQIVSGVAINLIAPGVTRFLSSEVFAGHDNGTITNSPAISGRIGRVSIPGISDLFEWIDEKRWFFISDVAGALRAFVDSLSFTTVIVLLSIPVTIYVLWHTAFGLRLRSVGEKPTAAESLGVGVYRLKYVAVSISGMLAGLGGAWLVIDIRQYSEGQTSGRGFLGLAALIFGNWQPIGVALGAALFSYGISLQQAVGTKPIKALYLFIAGAFLAIAAFIFLGQRGKKVAIGLTISGLALFIFYLNTDQVNNQIVYITPYVIVLVVITFASKRSRPPAAVGIPWRPGQE